MFLRLATLIAAATLAGHLAAAPASAAVNLVQNGGFEEPEVPPTVIFPDIPSSIPAWSTSTIELWHAPLRAFEGNQYIRMVTFGGIQQMLNTIPGQEYEYRFAHTAQFDPYRFEFTIQGGSIKNVDIEILSAGRSIPAWHVATGSFVATAGVTVMQINHNIGHPYLDGFSVTAVSAAIPEPATWAMMLIGFAGLGVAARRRAAAHAG